MTYNERFADILASIETAHSQSSTLLFEMLRNMSFEQLENLSGLEVGGRTILTAEPNFISFEYCTDSKKYVYVGDLSQTELNTIIGFILENKINEQRAS